MILFTINLVILFFCCSYFSTSHIDFCLVFLKLFISSPIASLPPTSCIKGQWITIPYVTPYQLSTYHILTYPSLVIPLFSMMKCNSLFNSSHTSNHLCCPYLCLFFIILLAPFQGGITRMPYCVQDVRNTIIYTVVYCFQFCSLFLY